MSTHTPGPGCPFRSAERAKQFRAALADYANRVPALFRKDGSENRSNNFGEAFWRGFNAERFIWSREAPIWVAYRAGAAIAKAEGRS